MANNETPNLESLLQTAVELDASDLHLIPGEPPIYRVKGTLQRAQQDAISAEEVQAILEMKIGADKAARIGSETGHVIAICDVPAVAQGRMCVTRAGGKLNATIRILPGQVPDSKMARVPQALIDAVMNNSSGLIITAGEVGSGKTTTAMMLLEYLNTRRPVRIVTIEDPIGIHLESKLAVITQQNIDTDAPNFGAALRAVLRLDPDVLFLGEIRDIPTLEACITAAEAGNLVITQLHAATPEKVIQRIIDVYPEENKGVFRRRLASMLRAVSTQKLLPSAKSSGRVAAYGVLVVDKEMQRAISDGKDIHDRSSPLPEGCQTIAQDIRQLQAEGLITAETAEDALASLEI
ncbi:MAG: Flp pilus assembly complex ATPase component TadA [Phycisphaerae bacterium]|nr:Flp pilus assembly complex ATPase component TadA [Phycisphaerae bacterium]